MNLLRTIRWRLAVAYAGFALLTLALLAFYFYLRVARNVEHQLDRFLDDEFNEMEHMLLEGNEALDEELELVARFHKEIRLFVQIRNEDGSTFRRTANLNGDDIPFTAEAKALAPGQSLHRSDDRVQGINVRVRTKRVRTADGKSWFLQVALSKTEEENARAHFLTQAAAAAAPFLLLSILGGYVAARRAIRPIDSIAAAASRIQESNLSERVPLRGSGDELDQLAAVLNSTFEKLEQSFRRIRDFSASASHQIRTPLTVIRGEAELLLKQGLEDRHLAHVGTIVDEAARLSRIVEQLLFLARVDAEKVDIEFQEVDLRSVVAQGIRRLEPYVTVNRLKVEERGDGDQRVNGSESLLATAVQNLLDNAAKFSPADGRIIVQYGRDDGMVTLDVEDDGEGIRPEFREKVMERFFRADVRKGSGTGLGLAVAREVAHLHGGTLAALDPQEGRGAHFRLRLPSAKP